jgi:hypothetical protein
VRTGLVAASLATLALLLPSVAGASGPSATRLVGTGSAAPPRNGSSASAAALDSPQAIAVDGSGDLAVADTNACSVVVIPSHRQHAFGRTMAAGHVYVVAGGSCSSHRGVGFPLSVAWGGRALFVVNGATDSDVAVGQSGHIAVVAGNGRSGAPRLGAFARTSPLDHPAGVATDAAGDLFIADTGDCRVLMVPGVDGTFQGQAVAAGHLYAVAGTGTCTLANASGAARTAALSAPTAVSVDAAGDLFVTESGRQDVDEVPAGTGTYFGVPIAAGDIAPVAGSGSNNTFLAEGQPATGPYAELNYPGGTTSDAAGNLFIAGGYDRAVYVVPAHDTVLWGRHVSGGDLYTAAGAAPATTAGASPGDVTQWIGPRLVDPTGVAWSGGRLLVVDRGANKIVALS